MQGFPPYDAPQRQEKDRLPQALARLRGVYTDDLIHIIEWCMALDPLSRPQSVFALQRELAREAEALLPETPSWWERVRTRFGLGVRAPTPAPAPVTQRSSFLEPP